MRPPAVRLRPAASPGCTVVIDARRNPSTPYFFTPSLALEIGVLLALSVLVPFFIHLLPVPEDARLGPRLLPMFYAPLLGALLGRRHSAVAVALVAPWLNWMLTGHPTPAGAALAAAQLVVFVASVRLLVSRLGSGWYFAAPAYLASLAAAMLLGTVAPALIGGRPVLGWASQTLALALPGIIILVTLNWLVVRHYPASPDESDGPTAA